MEVRNFGEAVYINEPTFIPNPNNPLIGWIIIVSYDSKKDTSYVHILNEDTMEDICKLELPSTIGNCSHGKWKKMN
jgi:carotenoid cleavage dioxygenase-like enzyme